jgi:hypothetical protein
MTDDTELHAPLPRRRLAGLKAFLDDMHSQQEHWQTMTPASGDYEISGRAGTVMVVAPNRNEAAKSGRSIHVGT